MQIVFTRLTADRHRLEVFRDGMAVESIELETRSMLVHDLVHYAVERAGGFTEGFYGRLASGVPLASLREDAPDEAWQVESIVGPLQGLLTGARAMGPGGAFPASPPEATHPDADFLGRVEREFRALYGAWKATPYGGQLILEWPRHGSPTPPPRVATDG